MNAAGALKEQIDRLVEKFCETMTNGDALNFRAAVSVGRVQRKWQARTRAAKLMRKKEWRRARAQAPDYSKVCEDRAHLIAAFDLLKLVRGGGVVAGPPACSTRPRSPRP